MTYTNETRITGTNGQGNETSASMIAGHKKVYGDLLSGVGSDRWQADIEQLCCLQREGRRHMGAGVAAWSMALWQSSSRRWRIECEDQRE